MKIGSVVITCFEFDKMLIFWQEALGYTPKYPPDGGFVILSDPRGKGPNLSLDKVPTKRTGKRSRLHLDLYTNNQTQEVDRLVKLGATLYPWRYTTGDDFIVLADPYDNLFCVIQAENEE